MQSYARTLSAARKRIISSILTEHCQNQNTEISDEDMSNIQPKSLNLSNSPSRVFNETENQTRPISLIGNNMPRAAINNEN